MKNKKWNSSPKSSNSSHNLITSGYEEFLMEIRRVQIVFLRFSVGVVVTSNACHAVPRCGIQNAKKLKGIYPADLE